MDLQTTTLIPPLTALAAALAAGGISYSNLIVSKDNKTSEFRQAWINGLRDELAAFLANTRTMARAVQETRDYHAQEDENVREANAKFHISPAKITETRHSVADTLYKIKLRLNPNEAGHAQLLKLLEALTAAQNNYLADVSGNIESVFKADEEAAKQAARVLKAEWERVKVGEAGYRRALNSAWSLLIAIFVLLFALSATVFFSNGPTESKANVNPVEASAPLAAAPPAAPSATQAQQQVSSPASKQK